MKAKQLAGGSKGGFELREGKVFYKDRYLIPKSSQVIPTLLFEYHDFIVGGHGEDVKTYLRLAQEWFWPGMRKTVVEYVKKCKICLRHTGLILPPRLCPFLH